MRTFVYCIAAMALWVLTPGFGPKPVDAAQNLEITGDLCARQTTGAERSGGIPRHLLTAISHAESGRWNAARKENVAWPWTVTAGGKGHFFDTKAEAVAAVRRLRAKGVSNIDVGCMQINLHYHADAFANLEQAFDPHYNVAYGAQFLRALHERIGSWTIAAGYYHSRTPTRSRSYRLKVVRLWDRVRLSHLAETGAPPAPAAVAPPPPIDMVRTARLNARFRTARETARRIHPADLHRRQLEAWRQAGGSQRALADAAAMQRARLESRQKAHRMGRTGGDFAARRAEQLKTWREFVATGDGSS